MFLKIQENIEIKNTQNTQIKCKLENQTTQNTERQQNKTTMVQSSFTTSARKQDGFILQRSWAHTGPIHLGEDNTSASSILSTYAIRDQESFTEQIANSPCMQGDDETIATFFRRGQRITLLSLWKNTII